MGHYFENVGDEPVQMLELFRSDHFADVSANQWLALTPLNRRRYPKTEPFHHRRLAQGRDSHHAVGCRHRHRAAHGRLVRGVRRDHLSGHAFHRLGNRIELGSYEETPAKIRLS